MGSLDIQLDWVSGGSWYGLVCIGLNIVWFARIN